MCSKPTCPPAKERRTFEQLAKDMRGKWPAFADDMLSAELSEAIDYIPHHVGCPKHGGGDGFRLFHDFEDTGGGVCNTCGPRKNGFAMYAWLKDLSLKDAVKEVAKWLDKQLGVEGTPVQRASRKPIKRVPKIDPHKAAAAMRSVLRTKMAFHGSPAERYLINRGIWLEHISSVLYAHPGLRYYHPKEKKDYGNFPCLVAPIKNIQGELIALHRIFLTQQGLKAPVPDPKKMMSPCKDVRGAAIRLFEADGDTLSVAEGIETALAVRAVTQTPVWSCICATLLELVQVPEHVKRVIIWADLDASGRGLEAAEKLANRLEKEGKIVEIYLPFETLEEGCKGIDWLDVLIKRGINGFPAKWRRFRLTSLDVLAA